MRKVKSYFDEGYNWVVDIDLASYFNAVNHELVLNMLIEEAKDERLI
jgi:retron-type reverse transcriptase